MLIECKCAYKPECGCELKRKIECDGLSYRAVRDADDQNKKRVWFVDIENAKNKNIEALKASYINACDVCVKRR